jgi:hypothetical protein
MPDDGSHLGFVIGGGNQPDIDIAMSTGDCECVEARIGRNLEDELLLARGRIFDQFVAQSLRPRIAEGIV